MEEEEEEEENGVVCMCGSVSAVVLVFVRSFM